MKIILLTVTPFILLPAPAIAEDAGEQARIEYVMPQIPDEQTKRAALMMGYHMNDDSMVRTGSIDLSHIFSLKAVKTEKVIPVPDKKVRK